MTTVTDYPRKRTLDPALKKLLDELPQSDPDREYAVVYSPWVEGSFTVAVGEPFENIVLGIWCGPSMFYKDIPIYAIIKGKTSQCHLTYSSQCMITKDMTIVVSGVVVHD